MDTAQFQPLTALPDYSPAQRLQRAREFADLLRARRTVREFASTPVDRQVIEHCLWAAGSAPSGANMQPWRFVVVADLAIKTQLRVAAEDEEKLFYEKRATEEWLADLAPLGTDWRKPFLEIAPYLIVVFSEKWHFDAQGIKHKHYYVPESVGIAAGMLIAALHNAGLATLTHTPSPMGFLNKVLNRPDHERAEMIIVTGLPAPHCQVPVIGKKSPEEFTQFI